MKKMEATPGTGFLAFEEYPEPYHLALSLLIPLWRGIPADYKRKYARNVWQQFEDNMRAAAYTASLSKFVNSICSRLGIVIAGEDVAAVNDVLNAGQDRAILRQLRDEATTLALMVRMENDKRKAEWEARQADARADEARAFGLFATGGES